MFALDKRAVYSEGFCVCVCFLILQIPEFTFILFFDGLFTLCGKAKDAGVIDCWR